MRRRETLDIPATAANIKYAARLRAEVQNAIERGTFDYGKFFPSSKHADKPNLASAVAIPTIPELIETRIQRARKTGSLSPSSIKSYAGWRHMYDQPLDSSHLMLLTRDAVKLAVHRFGSSPGDPDHAPRELQIPE